jgi:glycosyltransferase involved in cell wall biosynthesis
MLGYSGIGTYLANVVPTVLRRCAQLDPIVISQPDALATTTATFGQDCSVRGWPAKPLTLQELTKPPEPVGTTLWWSPHFNVPLRRSGPLIVTLHDILPLVDPRADLITRIAARIWLARVRSAACNVICVSEFTRGQAVEHAGIDPGRTTVIPLGPKPPPAAQQTPPLHPYILFIGLPKRHKNVGGLLRAFERIMPNFPHRLVIVGRRRGLRRVDASAIEHASRLGDRVEWREHVPENELARLLAGATLVVQPSFTEGFGLPPLDAMACGVPVLAAAAGALPEVCGDAAIYCDPRSPEDIAARMTQILGDAALRARMSIAGRQRAAHFSWALCADRTAAAMLEAADAIGCRPRRG